MTAPDAPPVEPLTLEEALANLGERGFTLAVYHHEDAPREYVLHDVYSAFARGSFGHWKDAVEAVLGVPVVPRDDTAELIAYLEKVERWEADLILSDPSWSTGLPTFTQELFDRWIELQGERNELLARHRETDASIPPTVES